VIDVKLGKDATMRDRLMAAKRQCRRAASPLCPLSLSLSLSISLPVFQFSLEDTALVAPGRGMADDA